MEFIINGIDRKKNNYTQARGKRVTFWGNTVNNLENQPS